MKKRKYCLNNMGGGGADFTYIFFYFLSEFLLYKLPFPLRYIGGGGG